ncbi:MAG TPA: KpsF/GutQ family sugar-phosphate isomerase [Phycisphaerales bacterium]|nr:KpsF/GutQ family sugar-phosphate isomerase [Phycisphaerales bacterium]HIB00914.1 KpsF/GutQ family sugar-phosphate isomerase [Phycisphaerales bacterium]HIB50380.1 KpsF/GutQ family sugar-phosphate isomerase [Phycisphaerales bacterium]HIN84636.1 KpsF/GutQ family sugar-phosphate isomerase [Phycisphaerales bacterium]HIO20116.1 KpsF/GutQ family sugar-phosphate isomerase [Phycisphaerales bacterium]
MSTQQTHSNATLSSEHAFICDVLTAEVNAVQSVSKRIASDNSHAEAWTKALDILEKCDGHTVFSGMGKSGLIGAKLSSTFSSIGQPSHVVHPAEAVHGDLGSIRRADVVILMSYSGTTEEVVNLAAILRTDGIPCIGISKADDSPLAKLCTVHLAIGSLSEACPLNLAPTASTTATLAIGDALGLALSRRRNFTADEFHKHHPGGMLGIGLRTITEIIRFKVGENVPVIQNNTTVGDALQLARPAKGVRRAGAILLVDTTGKLTGIFTDGDLRRLVIDDKTPMVRTIGDVATSNPRRLLASSLVRDAKQLVAEYRVDEIPIVDDDNFPIGLIDVQDLIAMKVVTE